jgi:hypothetical protein
MLKGRVLCGACLGAFVWLLYLFDLRWFLGLRLTLLLV